MDLPKQDLSVNLENKQNFGEVHTPYSLIERIFTLIPESVFSDPKRRWLDRSCQLNHLLFPFFH